MLSRLQGADGVGLAGRLRAWARRPPLAQGRHIDPGTDGVPPPDPSQWSPLRRTVFTSAEMEAFRAGLLVNGSITARAGVLDDLSQHYGLDTEECLARCLQWEEDSVAEWSAEQRDTQEARIRFYQSTQSWSFDLMWWAYLQSEGYGEPQGPIAAWWAVRNAPGRRHLDFGSGTGTTSQVFLSLGYSSELADVSTSLLQFAAFRFQRRDLARAGFRDLSGDPDLGGPYDVVTAIDALAHVPDIRATATELHRVIVPGGVLIAGIDARPATAENAWHLQHDELTARYALQRVGFRPIARLGTMLTAYERVEAASVARWRAATDWLLLASPMAHTAQRGARGAAAIVRRNRPKS